MGILGRGNFSVRGIAVGVGWRMGWSGREELERVEIRVWVLVLIFIWYYVFRYFYWGLRVKCKKNLDLCSVYNKYYRYFVMIIIMVFWCY